MASFLKRELKCFFLNGIAGKTNAQLFEDFLVNLAKHHG